MKAPVLFVVSSVAILSSACSSRTGVQQVEWNISWSAVTATTDGKPVDQKPQYVVEAADDERAQDWKTLWQGEATTAVVKTAPGHQCFRVLSMVNKTRSEPSIIGCGTKLAGDARPAQKNS